MKILNDIDDFVEKLKQADIDFILLADLNSAFYSCGHGSINDLTRLLSASIANLSFKTNTPLEKILEDIVSSSHYHHFCLKYCGKIPSKECIENCFKEILH